MNEPEECDSCHRPKNKGEHEVVLRPDQIRACAICGADMSSVCTVPSSYENPIAAAIAPVELAYRCAAGHMHFGPVDVLKA